MIFKCTRTIVSVLFILVGLAAFAQDPFNVWIDRFPNSNNQSGPATVEITFDGGYITAGNVSAQSALNLTKFTSTGVMEWSKDFGPGYGCAAFAAIQLKDSGYAAVGLANQNSMYVVRTDRNGTLLWSKTYNISAGNWIQQTLDGGLVLGGYTGSGYRNSVLVKTDINGTVQWSKSYSYNNYNLVMYKGVQLSDSSYALGFSGGNGMVLVKADKNGAMQWVKEYQINSQSYSFSMRHTRDNGYIMVGTDSYGPGRGPAWHAIKVDAAGTLQWSKVFYPTYATNATQGYCYDVEELDYGYALCGFFYDNPPGAGYSTSYLAKLDPAGTLLWARTFNEQYWDWLFSVRQTADKGLVTWGHTQVAGSLQRGNLIKTDSLGQGTCKFATQTMKDTVYTSFSFSPSISVGNSVITGTNANNTYNSTAAKQYFPCAVPPVAKFAADDTTICSGGSVTFTDQSLNIPTSWKWTFDGGSPSGSAIQNPTITYNTAGTYLVKLVATNGSGADSLTKTGYIVVTSGGVAGVISANPDSICPEGTSELTVAGVAGAIQWQSATTVGSFSNISDADTSYYNTPPVNTTTYYRTISGTGFCTDTSAVFGLVVNPAPTPPVLSAGETTICANDSTTITSSGTYTSYLWNNNQTTSSVQARQAGGYWVTVTNAEGCTAVSERENIQVYPVPSVSIIVQGDTLTSFNATSYQWYKDGVLIQGANSAIYIAQATGDYSVEITDVNGCTTISTPVRITVTGIADISTGTLSVYPNPATAEIFISFTGSWLSSELRLYNMMGQEVKRQTINQANGIIRVDLSTLPSAVYELQLMNGQNVISRKLVKD